ncbi:TPA: hypothetical protein N0F65_003429 [Lagenidium giganteum]|uniref:Cation efflux protein cytoplasmic domain-containing protein n=1 Tax=Lagenidium giganteum TaxID=4803 RepID=A0AAV2YKP5_9STRA|nr:TPA: hypothetical protein N0F65_003429 [Lagenidium giganteum]
MMAKAPDTGKIRPHLPPSGRDHVSLVLQLSVATNVVIVVTMMCVAITSRSLALVSALAENMVDLFVQMLLWYIGVRLKKHGPKASERFPAGTARFEPVGIIAAASMMMLVAAFIIQESITRLVNGFVKHASEQPLQSIAALVIVTMAIVVKLLLIVYASWVLESRSSAAVQAILTDNRNDAISNAFAIAAYIAAAMKPELWWLDAGGAIFIFLFIIGSWAKLAHEQVLKLVGICAEPEFIDQMKQVCAGHHELLQLDTIRAYHSGSKYIVEVEALVPGAMTIAEAHDIGLQLQFKFEQHEDVERAFVHLDHERRDYDEHAVSREPNAIELYASGLEIEL